MDFFSPSRPLSPWTPARSGLRLFVLLAVLSYGMVELMALQRQRVRKFMRR